MLDHVSATLVQQLAAEGGLPLVLTVRTGDPCPEAITTIWKDGLAERVEVDPLAPDACAALLGAALGGPVGWIKRGAGGGIGANRRDAAETVASLIEDGEQRVIGPRPRRGGLLRRLRSG